MNQNSVTRCVKRPGRAAIFLLGWSILSAGALSACTKKRSPPPPEDALAKLEPVSELMNVDLFFDATLSMKGFVSTQTTSSYKLFNSPFWPFVLATTSVGQEGLDFHHYCHAVVHWNLPSNPVDLEQREGRVHRYKGHAVRKNLAKHLRPKAALVDGRDPWEEIFEVAKGLRANGSDIVPYWVYRTDGGAYIERHVPDLPLSTESEHLGDLKRSLVVYRMVFGQSSQEDLTKYFLDQFPELRLSASPKTCE